MEIETKMNNIIESINSNYYSTHEHGVELLNLDLNELLGGYQEEIDDLTLQLENLQDKLDNEMDNI